MWKTNPKHEKLLACLFFSLFSLFFWYDMQSSTRSQGRAPEWNSCGWFRISNCCSSDCHSFLEPHPASKVGLTAFCCRNLPDQWAHLCWQNQDSQAFWLCFIKGQQHIIASPVPLLLFLLCEYTDMPKCLCVFPHMHRFIYMYVSCVHSFNQQILTNPYMWLLLKYLG